MRLRSGRAWHALRALVTRSELLPFLVLPEGWPIYTLIGGELVDWYPYPFIDVNEHGYAVVAAMCVAVAVVMLGLAVGRCGLTAG